MKTIRIFSLVTVMTITGVSLAQLAFQSPVSTVTGDVATDIVAGNWDGDADIDLAVANRDAGTVSILLNTAGVFVESQEIDVGTRPFAIVAADLVGSSAVDLAVAIEGTDQVAVLAGSAIGTFGSATLFLAGDTPSDIAVGDFNGDGELDIIVANRGADSVNILLNNGNGFNAATEVSVLLSDTDATIPQPVGVAVGDFNGDNDLDFATANFQRDNVTVRLGNGDGTFGPSAQFAASTNPIALLAADFDGDDNLDLAVANAVGDNVTLLFGDGSGAFGDAANVAAGNRPENVIAADIDGDGTLDLATANSEGDNVSVLAGNGDGTFDAAKSFDAGGAPVGVAAADFDGDGSVDLATSNEETDNMTLLIAGEAGLPIGPVNCPGEGCGPAGLGTFALLFGCLVGMKRVGRRWTA